MKNNVIMKMKQIAVVGFVTASLTVETAWCQAGVGTIPKIVEKDGRHALLVDGQPFLMLGGQAHNSSGSDQQPKCIIVRKWRPHQQCNPDMEGSSSFNRFADS